MPLLSNVTTNSVLSGPLPRLGQISFINCLPVVLPIEKGQVELPAQTYYASPAELNKAYSGGNLDLGAMSSFYYLERSGLELITDLSISSDGPVGSVLFFSRVAPHKLNGARIAAPASSATSVNLLRVLLLEQLNVRPEIVIENEPSLDNPKTAGALLIGDRALAFDGDWANKYWRADLGQWWRIQTGLPMVFGLWAARNDWAARNQQQFQAVAAALRSARDYGLNSLLPLVVNEATNRTALPQSRLQRYYQAELNFQLTQKHHDGLQLFRELCQHHGLLAAPKK
jgi:chorismate dehydratase